MADVGSFVDSPHLAGARDLFRKLVVLGGLDSGNLTRNAVRAGIGAAYRAAQQRIPVGDQAFRTYTGRLVAPGFAKRNIRVISVLSKDKKTATAILGVRKEAYYAVQFVEMGTSKMGAQQWLRPSFYGTAGAQQQGMVAYLQKRIDKIAKTGAI